jgi:hypothetical protein
MKLLRSSPIFVLDALVLIALAGTLKGLFRASLSALMR